MTNGQKVRIQSLDSHGATDKLIKAVRGFDMTEPVQILLSDVQRVFPNGVVPFAAAVAHLRRTGWRLDFPDASRHVNQTHVLEALTVENFVRHVTPVTHTVWEYQTEAEAQTLANIFVDVLTDQVRCESGVIDVLNWCLYEVMDNVFQHSDAKSGFVMMQIHQRTRRCAVAVSDTGIGIQKSLFTGLGGLKFGHTEIREAHKAIEYAAQAGVTSKGKQNQGNGLYGLRSSVELNGGMLQIHSGRGQWSIDNTKGISGSTDLSRPVLDAIHHHATTVDWQLDCSRPVRITDALGVEERSSDFLETIETENGYYRIGVSELEEALGSRSMGREIRNRLSNYLNAGAEQVVLDFSGIGVVSSSFADEVLGKLAAELGELEYRRRIFIDSASPTNRALVERAVALRLESGV